LRSGRRSKRWAVCAGLTIRRKWCIICDIANALLAAYQAHQETATVCGHNPQFTAGYRAALATIALFFGLAPGQVLPDPLPAPRSARPPAAQPVIPGNS